MCVDDCKIIEHRNMYENIMNSLYVKKQHNVICNS